METIVINNRIYEIVKDYRDALIIDNLEDKISDYFYDFDYILGDYAYGKVRLKGFNSKNNKNYKDINDIEKIDEYINENCAYNCRYFILKFLSVEK